ncbi:MAG: SMP-30/gluconolactonase/LRE family protein [Lachnospiraceae bacterium]|nr:SMP-30/gluconolactonase/LRE family protein [Lachnospiraceae bacterium]
MKRISRISALMLAFLMTVMLICPVRADAAQSESYVTGDDNYRQPVPECYVVTDIINNLRGFEDKNGTFRKPQDLFIDDNDFIYVVDTGNKRIVKMNPDFETVATFKGPGKAFANPQGIFVDDDGDMYVADTENNRIVHMDPEGALVEEFVNPESELDTGAVFTPTKLVVTQTGYIYTVKGENIMAIDGNNGFRGFYGQTNIGYDLAEALFRMFASERQKAVHTKKLAASYINLTYGKDGMIYATSMEREEGEIKKLNSIGTNIYRKYKTVGNSLRNPITDFIENKLLKTVVAGQSFKFGEYFDDDGNYIEPVFVDVCVDNNGIVTVVEQLNGKVYQYDQDGRMLVAFGGLGEKNGTFTRPSAIDVDSKGRLYVLDQINNNIQVFEPTEFIQYIHDATSAYNNGDYARSYELWNTVLSIDENYTLAHVGIARAYYKQQQYKDAMEESKIVDDRDVYTMAFDEYKYEVLRAHFFPIILTAVIIIVAVLLFIGWFHRFGTKKYWEFIEHRKPKMSIGDGLTYCFYAIFHPVDAMEGIKYNRDRLNTAVPIIIFVTAFVVRIAYLYVVHFPLASIETEDINPWFEMVKLLIVPLSWIPASFMATSISGGESKVKEITFASAISLVPFIVINVPLMFLSNIMSKSQRSWYGVFSTLAYIGLFLILLIAMMVLNNYTFGKTIGMMFVAAFLMLVLWLVMLLCYVLSGRVIQFVMSIIEEFRINFL